VRAFIYNDETFEFKCLFIERHSMLYQYLCNANVEVFNTMI